LSYTLFRLIENENKSSIIDQMHRTMTLTRTSHKTHTNSFRTWFTTP